MAWLAQHPGDEDLHNITVHLPAVSGNSILFANDRFKCFARRITTYPNGSIDARKVYSVDPDLIIDLFHQKGAAIPLRECIVDAPVATKASEGGGDLVRIGRTRAIR